MTRTLSPVAVATASLAVAAAVALVGLSGCGPTPLADGFAVQPAKVSCEACHGEGDNPAPPRSVRGETSTSDRGVGAHRFHLVDNGLRGAVECSECHVVPKKVGDAGHIDALPAEVTFGPLATAHDAQAAWNPETLTCATYCHGATLKGGTATEPRWTLVDGTQAKCDSCHGFPPPAPHTASTACALCHADTVDDAGHIRTETATHIDGTLQVKGEACNGCHGGPEQGGPPPDLHGNTATSALGVGAHRAHTSGEHHAAIDCATCHLVPVHLEDTGHIDDGDNRAEVTLAGLAVHDGHDGHGDKGAATYDKNDFGCSATYCHGSGRPIWNVVDGTNARCDACHGFPPTTTTAAGILHPQRTDCATCHGNVVNADNTFVAPALHVDGVVETESLRCDACHGGDGMPAPPRDLLGNTATSAPGVGAHAAHLASSTWRAPIQCGECHLVPGRVDAPGHIDDARPADISFGPTASARNASPAFFGSGASVGCSNIACHGGAPADAHDVAATNREPRWTIVDGSQAACGTCHGLPPSAPHPSRSDCASCHGDVIDASGSFVNPAKHVNGVVDVACNACHGDHASPAPPRDLAGNVSTTLEGVGAHRAHLGPSSWHRVVQCSECHVVPDNVESEGHIDDFDNLLAGLPAEVVFGPLASSNGVTPAIQNLRCAVYCHGGGDAPTISGGTNNAPLWTKVDATQATCGSCHGVPPPAPHPDAVTCEGCHPYQGLRPIDPNTHVNGVLEVTP